jgi:hypothetical protein
MLNAKELMSLAVLGVDMDPFSVPRSKRGDMYQKMADQLHEDEMCLSLDKNRVRNKLADMIGHHRVSL